MQLKEQIEKIQDNLAIATLLTRDVSDRLPGGVASITVGTEQPTLYIAVGYSKSDRERVLALVGEVFGTLGWIKKLGWQNDSFTWKKEVRGVIIEIANAQDIPKLEEQPVAPAEFPVLLQDSNEPEVEVVF